MLSTPKAKGGLFLASSLCDGLEDYNIRQVATLLLNKDADPNILIPTHGVTPFHLVIGNDSEEFAEEVTKLFLRHGGNPNVRSNDGMTPVHVAAAWGRINILQLLLANGGDPLCVDNDGRSPFHYAFEGKYFKAVTMLSNYCENVQDQDDKPKYNMVLDKVLITNGDKVAEYVASKDTLSDVETDKITKKSVLTDFHNFEPNSSSMIVDSSRLPDACNIIETKSKLSADLDKCLSISNDKITAQQQNNLSRIDEKKMTNYSFIDLDFDFANLHLNDVMQKEKCLVSQIISHLSSSLASDCTINDTLHNYKRNKQEESSIATSNSDAFQLKNTDTLYKHEYYKNPKSSSSRLKNNFNKDILRFGSSKVKKQCSKYNAQSTSKKKYKKIAEKISPSTNIFNNNSIVSMSPNFNTPNHRKRRNIAKTPLTLLHIHNDSIVSKSPNFATSVCTSRKINSAKTSHVDSYFSPKVFKKSQKCKTQTQSDISWYEKHIAQSTPRRKKRSIYKFRSSKKRFDPYRYESDVTSDESSINNILKPSDLDKTIFSEASETTARYDILNMSSECSSSFFKKSSKVRCQNYNNHLAIKLDDGRYDEDDITCDNSNINLLNSSFNQTEKENESINNSSSNKKYAKSVENNKIDDRFVTIRKDIFKTDKMPKTIDISIDNVKSACTIETDPLHKKNFVDCVDCDTKKLLNEDINMNISNIHAKNWYKDRFHEFSSHKLITENNSLTVANLPIKCKKHVCLSEKSWSSKINGNNIDSKRAEDISKAINLDVCKMEKNSSLFSYVSTLEEYKYEDLEEGVTLLERRFCVISFNESKCSSKSKILMSCASSTFDSQNLPMELLYIDDAALRTKLRQFGDEPGPITKTTKQVYLKRLMRLTNIRDAIVLSMSIPQNMQGNQVQAGPSNQIEARLQFGTWLNELDIYRTLERDVFQEFSSPDPSRRWREGMAKTSFTYLLLDPRITQNLPNRADNLTEPEVWSIFLSAIFYIGKGKRSRPFSHLYDAFHAWTGTKPDTSRKVSCILDIWNNDCGVICLHVFQNIIPVEAYTREAAMIDAIGKEQLGNCISGKYYGIAATWSMQQKQKFGRYLLYKAMQIFMHEGENQVFPENLG